MKPRPDISKRPNNVPKNWEKKPSDKGEGIKYIDPKNKGNEIRVQKGDAIRIDVEQEEGDAFWIRGTHAISLGNDTYKILPTPHYNPDEQNWKFPPGSIVRLKEISSGGFNYLVPSEKIA